MKNNKKKNTGTDRKRKFGSYHVKNLIITIIMIPSIIASMLISFRGFTSKAIDNLEPQICRAVAQAAKLLPQIENNDEALREVYDKMKESRSRLSYNNNEENSSSTEEIAEGVSSSLSWMERITKLKVGRNGYVMVTLKNDGTVLAHPDDSMVGRRIIIADPENGSIKDEDYRTDHELSADISIEDIEPDITPDKLDMRFHLILPEGSDSKVIRSFKNASIGYVAAYKDTLIICGVDAKEVISFVLAGLGTAMISVLLLWIFLRYVRCDTFDEKQ